MCETALNSHKFSVIQSFFIPNFSLQGGEFPIHLLWDKEENISRISLKIPFDIISLKEVYNVNGAGLKVEENTINVTSFERNGYVGFVFKSRIREEPFIEVPIRIEVHSSTGKEQIIEHKIIFFRPHVIAREIPARIELIKKDEKILLSKKIALKNEGKGTAIVNFEVSEESSVTLKKPEEVEEFIERFCLTFSAKMENARKEYPQYLEVINDFEMIIVDLIKGTFKISEEYLERMQDTLNNLEKSFEENENFLKDILEAILAAYLSAINILTEVRSFLEFLRSLAENKVILLGASSLLEFKPGLNLLKGRLLTQDLAGNVHKPIDICIEIEVKSDSPVMIPIYAIFEW